MKKFIPFLTILLGLAACKKDDVKTSNEKIEKIPITGKVLNNAPDSNRVIDPEKDKKHWRYGD